MNEQTLDKPEEKRLHGLDLRINRYHLINPDNGELMILELRSTGYSAIIALFLFGSIGVFAFYLSYHYYNEEGTLDALLIPMGAGIFMFCLVALGIYGSYFSKANWYFTTSEFIDKPSIDRSRIFPRDKVKSVLIDVTHNYQNGSYSSSTYFVSLKIDGWKGDKGHYKLLHINDDDVAKSPGFGRRFTGIFGAQAEAEQIAGVISEHWNIPLSI